LVTPPSSKGCLPENVDPHTLQVTFDNHFDIAMDYVGIEKQGHEFKCGAQSGQCSRSVLCPQFRHIPFDNGYFQRILHGSAAVSRALEIRKNGERPFNLFKKREGLEQVRVKSQSALVARTTLTPLATFLLELAVTRKIKKVKQKQKQGHFVKFLAGNGFRIRRTSIQNLLLNRLYKSCVNGNPPEIIFWVSPFKI